MATFWVATALFVVGILSGATIRLPMFAIVLVAAAAVVMLRLWSQGIGPAILQAALTAVVLQIGYGCGILLRSAIQAYRVPRDDRDCVREGSRVRLPTEPKQH